RYAGRYEGQWTSDRLQLERVGDSAGAALFLPQSGHLRGDLIVEVACDGTLVASARGQTDVQPRFSAVAQGDEGTRVMTAALGVVTDISVQGALAPHRFDATPAHVDAMLDGTVEGLAGEDDGGAVVAVSVRRAYSGTAANRWEIQRGDPSELTGRWEGSGDLQVAGGPDQPSF